MTPRRSCSCGGRTDADKGAGPAARRGRVSSRVSSTRTSLVRLAEPRDVPALSAIRAALSIRSSSQREVAGNTVTSAAAPSARGFLLGSSPETYGSYVAGEAVMVAESGGRVVAYSVVLPDALLRRSEVYEKREQAGLDPALLRRLERSRVAYYDQLAALPGFGPLAVGLAYRHLLRSLEEHDALLATTVVEPVRNVAAVPLLLGVGFQPVGRIDEVYPEAGRVSSCVYAVTREAVCAVRASRRALRFEGRLGSNRSLVAAEP